MPGELLVAIMAAGASRRLGQPKQLVEIDGQTLLARSGCIALEADVGPVMAVVGCNAVACAATLDRLSIKVVANEQWEEGLAASIRCAVRSAIDRNSGALLLLLADQYRVAAADIRRLTTVSQSAGEWIATRCFSGAYAGPPIVFPRRCFDQLMMLRGDSGGREIFASLPSSRRNDFFLPNAVADLDLPEQLDELNHTI